MEVFVGAVSLFDHEEGDDSIVCVLVIHRISCACDCACSNGPSVLLQKYWHKGAFFQAEDAEGESVLGDIMHRDYDGATGEDKVDRQMLPKIMQV